MLAPLLTLLSPLQRLVMQAHKHWALKHPVQVVFAAALVWQPWMVHHQLQVELPLQADSCTPRQRSELRLQANILHAASKCE